MRVLSHLLQYVCLLITSLLLVACAMSGSRYASDTPQARSAKLLDAHQTEVASAVALSLVYFCKNDSWPPQNTLASRNSKLANAFLTLQNYTDKKGIYHIRFKLKAPTSSGLDPIYNPEWIVSIPHKPSAGWAKAPVYVPVTIEGYSAGQQLKNIKRTHRFKAECKPDAAWATWSANINNHIS